MAKKCPLCGGKLKNNYCESCGYAVPDDEELSALYDMDPSNDVYGEKVREIIPDVQAEEIYPNRPEAPKFKVRDDEGKTVQGDYQSANPYMGQSEQKTPPPSYYANDVGRTPPPSPYASPSPPPSPYANMGNTGNAGGNFNTEILKEFAKKYWWYWLVLLFAPWLIALCLTLTLIRNSVIDQKYRWILIVSLIISIILPPW